MSECASTINVIYTVSGPKKHLLLGLKWDYLRNVILNIMQIALEVTVL